MEQIQGSADISCKKMFGEYLVYASGRPAILICDNTAFVKINDATTPHLAHARTGYPYEGARLHYIVDVDDHATLARIVSAIAQTHCRRHASPKTHRENARCARLNKEKISFNTTSHEQ